MINLNIRCKIAQIETEQRFDWYVYGPNMVSDRNQGLPIGPLPDQETAFGYAQSIVEIVKQGETKHLAVGLGKAYESIISGRV